MPRLIQKINSKIITDKINRFEEGGFIDVCVVISNTLYMQFILCIVHLQSNKI